MFWWLYMVKENSEISPIITTPAQELFGMYRETTREVLDNFKKRPPLVDFDNQQQVLEKLYGYVRRATQPSMFLLEGLPGVGKTTLLYKLLLKLTKHFKNVIFLHAAAHPDMGAIELIGAPMPYSEGRFKYVYGVLSLAMKLGDYIRWVEEKRKRKRDKQEGKAFGVVVVFVDDAHYLSREALSHFSHLTAPSYSLGLTDETFISYIDHLIVVLGINPSDVFELNLPDNIRSRFTRIMLTYDVFSLPAEVQEQFLDYWFKLALSEGKNKEFEEEREREAFKNVANELFKRIGDGHLKERFREAGLIGLTARDFLKLLDDLVVNYFAVKGQREVDASDIHYIIELTIRQFIRSRLPSNVGETLQDLEKLLT